jgi:uncharacterized protein YbbK (DUF523 family)
MTTPILVSKCLLGNPCQYDGTMSERQLEPELIKYLQFQVVDICPEALAGLSIPRPRMYLSGGDGNAVINGQAKILVENGTDITDQVVKGARIAVEHARQAGVAQMICRRRSPSCSSREIYMSGSTESQQLKPGIGVTTALIQKELGIPTIDLEDFVAQMFRDALQQSIVIYSNNCEDWTECKDKVIEHLRIHFPLRNAAPWKTILQEVFRSLIPELHSFNEKKHFSNRQDSDTVRFFEEVFNAVFGINLIDPNRKCRICTYPEGFLDTYILPNGICSACTLYLKNRSELTNYDHLGTLLRNKINRERGKQKFDAVVAFSGGKDSTYMMLRLAREYKAKLLCVMDDLNQQNEQAVSNAIRAAKALGAEFRILSPPEETKSIRRSFLRSGSSFCRLCLRSHFVRVYIEAIQENVPLVFFGLTPQQCLDCEDSIEWSLQAIRDVATPEADLNNDALLQRNKKRAFQGGFDVGFSNQTDRELFKSWEKVFDYKRTGTVPIIVPFFIFDPYPGETVVLDCIIKELGWEKPTMLLNRSNCRLLQIAGIMHRAVGRYHLNYKERATNLRFQGILHSETHTQSLFKELNSSTENELMTMREFESCLQEEFGISFEELPERVRGNLLEIFN